MDTLTKGYVPPKTLEEKFIQIQNEKKYLNSMIKGLKLRENKVREELGYPKNYKDEECDFLNS